MAVEQQRKERIQYERELEEQRLAEEAQRAEEKKNKVEEKNEDNSDGILQDYEESDSYDNLNQEEQKVEDNKDEKMKSVHSEENVATPEEVKKSEQSDEEDYL